MYCASACAYWRPAAGRTREPGRGGSGCLFHSLNWDLSFWQRKQQQQSNGEGERGEAARIRPGAAGSCPWIGWRGEGSHTRETLCGTGASGSPAPGRCGGGGGLLANVIGPLCGAQGCASQWAGRAREAGVGKRAGPAAADSLSLPLGHTKRGPDTMRVGAARTEFQLMRTEFGRFLAASSSPPPPRSLVPWLAGDVRGAKKRAKSRQSVWRVRRHRWNAEAAA